MRFWKQKKSKGKILRIKQGYNPNSSSVGSQIPYLFAFFVGSGILTLITLHVFRSVRKTIKNRHKNQTRASTHEK